MPGETQPRRNIHVVAGLLIENGRVCITRRHADAHQGGKWEFPGGKLEPGEARLAGLRRELHEELGIEVRQAEPFMQLHHGYRDLDVLLDVWRVLRYDGAAHGREGQEMRWEALERLDPREFPDADRPVLRRLQLPPLYIISDARRLGREEFLVRLERVLGAGARLVQLREPHMPPVEFCAYARRVAALCRRFGARLLVNAAPELLRECDADGVHLSSARLMALSKRPVPAEYWLGASCHNAPELERAAALGADFAVLGSVQPTASHPGAPILGWERFAELCQTVTLPVYALGGMRPPDLPRATATGAFGLAMISGVWDAENPEAVVRALTPSR
ncbi:MAG: Nudix family hydrolase [Sulfurifustis sp.]